MIDLSFLTEQEKATILGVLQRDTKLKKAEERRVRGLQRSVRDKGQLKYLSGEWFYETKSLRHRDRIHGGDIVRASIRPKHKPHALLEKSAPEKPSFLASDNGDVHVPQEDSKNRNEVRSSNERPPETQKMNIQSPPKPRKNPFNSEPLAPHKHPEVSETDAQPLAEPGQLSYSGYEEPLSPAELFLSCATNPDPELLERIPEEYPRTPSPVPIYRRDSAFYSSLDRAGQFHYPTPRGILKAGPDPASEPPPVSPLLAVPQSLSRRGSDAEEATLAGRDALGKQVRFCPPTGRRDSQQAGTEVAGEHSLLDADPLAAPPPAGHNAGGNVGACRTSLRQAAGGLNATLVPRPDTAAHQVPGDLSGQFHDQLPQVSTLLSTERETGKASYLEPGTEEEAQSHARAREWFKMGAGHTLTSAVEDASDIMPTYSDNSQKPSHANSPRPISSMLLERLSKVKAKDNNAEDEEEPADISVQPRISETLDNSVPLNHQINPVWVYEEPRPPQPREVRSQQPTSFEESAFIGSAASSFDTGSDPPEDLTKSQDMAQKLSELKAFWEGENSGPKVIFAREQAMHDDAKKDSDEEANHVGHAGSMMENPSPGMEVTLHYDTALSDDEMVFQGNESSNNPIDLPKEDGTYRACPILINDETDESLAGSVKDFQDNGPSGPETGFQHLPEDHSGPQEDELAKLRDVGVFWEKDYSTPKIIVTSFEEPSSDSRHSSPDKSEELFTPIPDPKEETENGTIISNPKPTIGKGFITKSLGKSQLSKRGHESESSPPRDRPLSPSMSSQSRDSSDDELRKSPSKTCHPKVLVRESSLPRGSIAEGSPLKTFPIDLALRPKDHKEEVEKPTPAPRLRTGLSQGATSTESTAIPSEEFISCSLSQTPEDSEKQSHYGTSKMHGTSTPLVRSVIPDDYEHYLGSPETAHLPPFEEEESTVDSNMNLADATSKPRRRLRRQGATYGKDMIEGNHSRIRSWIAQNAGSSSHKDKATSARSEFRSSSGSYDDDDDSSPVRSAPKQRPISMSQSMENLGAFTEQHKGHSSSQAKLNVSLDDAEAVAPSAFLSPDPLQARRMSKSVPALGLEEMDGDSPFGAKPRRRTASVVSDGSISSGLVSMSSISGSVASINQVERDVEVQGTMQFAVNYVQKLGELQIFVVQCRDLALAEPKKSRSDPYVKCYLVPDKTKLGKRKTSVKKRTLNPSYNEILRFKILMEVLKMQRLTLSVWHNDTFGRNSFLGEIGLDLSNWDFGNTEINEYALTPRALTQLPSPPPVRSKPKDRRGQMRVALRYLAQQTLSKKASKMGTGEVQIWVKDCKDLPPARGVIIDPFVKCTVLPDTSKKSRQKTRVVKRTASPMFNHTMVYDGFRPEDLKEACAEITVWDHDRLNNHFIGGLRLGLGTGKSYGAQVDWMDSLEPETKLWEKMMGSDGEWVEDVLPLRTFVVAKSMAK